MIQEKDTIRDHVIQIHSDISEIKTIQKYQREKIDKIENILEQHHLLFLSINMNSWIYKYFFAFIIIIAGVSIASYEALQWFHNMRNI